MTLTPESLTYYSSEGGELKGTVDVRYCMPSHLEIVPPSVVDFGASKWRLAIQTPSRRLVVAAPSEHAMHAWAFALLTLFKSNEGRFVQQGVVPVAPRGRRSSIV
ncbi:hypothetical protein DYB32_005758 [Aphanomyces invadans]|nr:hypothetical protein DYB32_005758 [Aphanomyces invadans]